MSISEGGLRIGIFCGCIVSLVSSCNIISKFLVECYIKHDCLVNETLKTFKQIVLVIIQTE